MVLATLSGGKRVQQDCHRFTCRWKEKILRVTSQSILQDGCTNKLVFGIASVPAIWQRAIMFSICPKNTVLWRRTIVKGESNEEYLKILQLALNCREENRLWPNYANREFLKKSISITVGTFTFWASERVVQEVHHTWAPGQKGKPGSWKFSGILAGFAESKRRRLGWPGGLAGLQIRKPVRHQEVLCCGWQGVVSCFAPFPPFGKGSQRNVVPSDKIPLRGPETS